MEGFANPCAVCDDLEEAAQFCSLPGKSQGSCAASIAEICGTVRYCKYFQPFQEWGNCLEFHAVSTEVPKAPTHNLHHRIQCVVAAVWI